MLRSVGSGSYDGLGDEVVAWFGVRCGEFGQRLGPTEGSECGRRGTHGILYLSDSPDLVRNFQVPEGRILAEGS